MSSTDEDSNVPDTEERTEVREYLVIQEIQGNPQDILDVRDEKENLRTLDSQEEKEADIKNTLKELLIYTFFLVIISTGNRKHLTFLSAKMRLFAVYLKGLGHEIKFKYI
jgi:hypothetical protein